MQGPGLDDAEFHVPDEPALVQPVQRAEAVDFELRVVLDLDRLEGSVLEVVDLHPACDEIQKDGVTGAKQVRVVC